MSEIKLCKDCKWSKGRNPEYMRCNHPYDAGFCELNRSIRYSTVSPCGPSAKLFEPKPEKKPWWEFWK